MGPGEIINGAASSARAILNKSLQRSKQPFDSADCSGFICFGRDRRPVSDICEGVDGKQTFFNNSTLKFLPSYFHGVIEFAPTLFYFSIPFVHINWN
jgi:hypothetical protein